MFFNSFKGPSCDKRISRYYKIQFKQLPELDTINYYFAQQTEVMAALSQLNKLNKGDLPLDSLISIINDNTSNKDIAMKNNVISCIIRQLTYILNNEPTNKKKTSLICRINEVNNNFDLINDKHLRVAMTEAILDDVFEPCDIVGNIDFTRNGCNHICNSDILIYELLKKVIIHNQNRQNTRVDSILSKINEIQNYRFNWFIDNDLIDEAFVFILQCIGPIGKNGYEIIVAVKESARLFIKDYKKSSKYLTIKNMIESYSGISREYVGAQLCIGNIYADFADFLKDLKDIKEVNHLGDSEELSLLINLLDNDRLNPRREGLKYEITLAGFLESKSARLIRSKN